MAQHDLYILIEMPKNGAIQVNCLYKSKFIAKAPNKMVFVRQGVRFHVVVTGYEPQPIENIRRILEDYWLILWRWGYIVPRKGVERENETAGL